jgi:hypothetical protein
MALNEESESGDRGTFRPFSCMLICEYTPGKEGPGEPPFTVVIEGFDPVQKAQRCTEVFPQGRQSVYGMGLAPGWPEKGMDRQRQGLWRSQRDFDRGGGSYGNKRSDQDAQKRAEVL